MLATLATDTFTNDDWIFEPKLDGIRALTYVNDDGQIEIYSRRGILITSRYPSLVKEISKYKSNLIFDGEIVALDKDDHPSFEKLQQRSGLTRKEDIAKAEAENPIIYYVFDILFYDGEDLRSLPLKQRKEVLYGIIKNSKHIEVVQEMGSDGETAFKACTSNGLEGVVGKRLNSLYQSNRRSPDWLKIKSTQSAEFLICGYTQGTGSRKKTFGSLILGEHDKAGKLVHVCSVGTGFNDQRLEHLLEMMHKLKTQKCPFSQRPIGLDHPIWLKPELVAEIKYAERTKDGSLRVPVFLHLREDIEPQKIAPTPVIQIKPESMKRKKEPKLNNSDNEELLSKLENDEENLEFNVEGNRIALTHLNKAFWPKYQTHPIITKRDYLRYLIKISPWLLPHLRDRLITLIRFPQGIEGVKFFQKHQDNLPKFVDTVNAYTEHEKKDQEFLICNNLSTLIWLGQIADLELHTSHTRINGAPDAKDLPKTFTDSLTNIEKSLLNYPDYMVIDLDPYLYSGKEAKGAEPELHRQGFRQACKVALWFKELFDQLSIKSYIKTSGKTGLHIYVPIERSIDYATVRSISQSFCEHILEAHPEQVTMDWTVTKRTGKVFLDHNMNARSKSLASIYSPRVSREAAVSTPLAWDELKDVYPTDFIIETLPDYLSKRGDLWADILVNKNDLGQLLQNNVAIKKNRKRSK